MISSHALLFPIVAHIALTAFLYVLLTVARAPAIWGLGRKADGSNPWATVEPRISANLSNQFQLPLFFYVACLFLLSRPVVDSVQVWLAWVFIAGRLLHSYVHVMIPNVRLRGLVFTINFIAVLGMWFLLVVTESTRAA